jgi:hypothetical protein
MLFELETISNSKKKYISGLKQKWLPTIQLVRSHFLSRQQSILLAARAITLASVQRLVAACKRSMGQSH